MALSLLHLSIKAGSGWGLGGHSLHSEIQSGSLSQFTKPGPCRGLWEGEKARLLRLVNSFLWACSALHLAGLGLKPTSCFLFSTRPGTVLPRAAPQVSCGWPSLLLQMQTGTCALIPNPWVESLIAPGTCGAGPQWPFCLLSFLDHSLAPCCFLVMLCSPASGPFHWLFLGLDLCLLLVDHSFCNKLQRPFLQEPPEAAGCPACAGLQL